MKRFLSIFLAVFALSLAACTSSEEVLIPTLSIENEKYKIHSDGGILDIKVSTNVAVEVEIPSDADWIKQNTSLALQPNTFYFDIKPNEDYKARQVTIEFTNRENGLSDSVDILQAQKDAIVLSDSEYQISNAGEYLEFKILTNVDFSIIISDNAQDWIKYVQTIDSRSLDTKLLRFYVNSCSSEEDREGIITLSSGDITQSIIVKQDGLKSHRANLEKQREVLIEFYEATGGDNWIRNDNWCSDKPVGSWYGVTTNYDTGYIRELNIQSNNLCGSIPECIKDLTYLTELVLVDNQLSGNISHILSKCTNSRLEHLSICNNCFTGELPEFTEYMSVYDVSYNQFTGRIPESHIKAFDKNLHIASPYNTEYGCVYEILGNNLSGEVPTAMANHNNWVAHWRNILPQNPGYGFNRVDIPAPKITVKCFDDSLLDLDKEYKKNKYTIIFRWDPYCFWSQSYIQSIYKLYQKYKDEGLGLVCTTLVKYSLDEISPLTSVHKDIKVFWEVGTNQGGADDSWDNNPMHLGKYFFLFRTGATPYFHIVDNSGNIIFYGSGDDGNETVPQYHENRDEIYDFVANLFGDDKYEEEGSYTSTDYSQDGVVSTLQAATVGNGIDIVLMGDAYSDRQIANGTYRADMENLYNNLFTEEPYRSFKDHFNVHFVNVVSATEGYEYGNTTLGGFFGDDTLVGGNDRVVFDYALKAISVEEMDEALLIVAMNSNNYAGTCYMYYPTYTTSAYGSGVSVSYFPRGGNAETFAQLLHHEACGHGFAKLGDEYAYEEKWDVPSDYVSEIQMQQNSWGWWKNADFTNDPKRVKWAHFLSDTRYAYDDLGVFEGGLTYWRGVWRPTENSIMRYNTGGFNAPSREAIYYRIHKLAYGESWQYDYEKFVEWDAKNRKTAATRGVPYRIEQPQDFKPLTPPVVINHSWRDAR